MQSKSIKIYTHAASHKTKLLAALNTTSSASLMAGFKAFNNDIKWLFDVRQNKRRYALRTSAQRLSNG
jgi:hypothetical protein